MSDQTTRRRSRTRSGSAGLTSSSLLSPPPAFLVTGDSPPSCGPTARRSQSCRATGSRPVVSIREAPRSGQARRRKCDPNDCQLAARATRTLSDADFSCHTDTVPGAGRERRSFTPDAEDYCRRTGSGEALLHVNIDEALHYSSGYLDVDNVDSYRLRNFSLTPKGFVNRGDSFRRRRRSMLTTEDSSATSFEHRHSSSCLDEHTSVEAATVNQGAAVSSYVVALVGADGVGKTSLVDQLLTSESINAYDFDPEADGTHEMKKVSVELDGEESELQLITLTDLQNDLSVVGIPQGVVFVYSVIDKASFDRVRTEMARTNTDERLKYSCQVLVANKVDVVRSRVVKQSEGERLATSYGAAYTEVSVGMNHNCDQLLVSLLHQLRLRTRGQQLRCSTGGHPFTSSGGKHSTTGRYLRKASRKCKRAITKVFGKDRDEASGGNVQ